MICNFSVRFELQLEYEKVKRKKYTLGCMLTAYYTGKASWLHSAVYPPPYEVGTELSVLLKNLVLLFFLLVVGFFVVLDAGFLFFASSYVIRVLWN